MSAIVQSIIMIVLLLGVVVFMLKKLVDINFYNMSILLILLGLWITSSLLNISIIKGSGSWEWPLLIGASQLTQVMIRVPFGILSQKLRSRKQVVLIAVAMMIVLSFSLFFTTSYWALLLASIGFGVFGATYGLQNQYWSESWNIRNVFITSGMIITIYFIGKYTGSLIDASVTIDKDTVKWTMLGFILSTVVVSLIYVFLHKEDTSTILLDNKSSYAKDVSEMTFKHIFIFSTMIVFTTIAIGMVTSNAFVNFSDSKVLTISLWTGTIVMALLTAFILIRVLDDRLINIMAHVAMALGLILMIVSTFEVHSVALSFVGLMIGTIGLSAYTMSMFGMMLHIDHKNTLLVLGIWLSVKSFALGVAPIIGGETIIYSPTTAKYLLIGALSLVAVSSVFAAIVYKYTKPGFELIEELEYSVNHKKNYSEWK